MANEKEASEKDKTRIMRFFGILKYADWHSKEKEMKA